MSPYRRNLEAPATRARPASLWRRLRASLPGGAIDRHGRHERRRRLVLVQLARSAPGDFARLVHGRPPAPGEVVVLMPALSAVDAVRALRGCSADERRSVAEFVDPECVACRSVLEGSVRGFWPHEAPTSFGDGLHAFLTGRAEAWRSR